MYIEKWQLILIAGVFLYTTYRIEKSLEKLEDRIYDLEHPDHDDEF